MKVSVFSETDTDERRALTYSCLKELERLGCKLYISEGMKDALNFSGATAVDEKELTDCCDIAIAIGGDGTTVKVAKNAAIKGKPLLGINGGHLGFLSGLEKDELGYLKKLVENDYKIDERIMLKAEVFQASSSIATFHCLNDAVVTRGDVARMVDIKIEKDKRKFMSLRADGVIFSTPTGSTAYSLAAGGPVLSPDLDCYVITSICAHSISQRSIVVNSKDKLNVKVESSENNAILTCDGEKPFEIPQDAETVISLSPYKARLIKLKPDNFYEILTKKLIDR